MVELILAIGVAGFGYVKSRKFVRERLRFVDAVHKPAAPVIAGVGTASTNVPVPLQLAETDRIPFAERSNSFFLQKETRYAAATRDNRWVE